jgi:DNA-binding SARP family transcriptional activator
LIAKGIAMSGLGAVLPALRLFGSFEARARTGRQIAFPTEKAKQLLALLALERGAAVPRSRVVASLWSEGVEQQLRHSLNTEVWRVRRALADAGEDPSDWLDSRADSLAFKTDRGIWVDVIAFDDIVNAAQRNPDGPETPGLLRQAEAIYRGDLMSGVFDEWCLVLREAYRARRLALLEALLRVAKREGEWMAAIRISREILTEDPFLEHVHREVMRCYVLMGDRAAALRHYANLRRDLERELGVAPTRETVALHELLRTDETAAELVAPVSSEGPAPPGLESRLRAIQLNLLRIAQDIGEAAALAKSEPPRSS